MPKQEQTRSRDSGAPFTTNRVTLIICVAIIVVAIGVGAVILLYPTIMAKSELKKLDSSLNGDAIEILVSYPSQSSYITEPCDEKLYTEDEASELSSLLSSAIGSASYLRRVDSVGGNWDTRLRIKAADSVTYVIYLTDNNEFYLSKGNTRFYFSTDKLAPLLSYIGIPD